MKHFFASPKRGFSMAQQVFAALLVGVATGLFFSEWTKDGKNLDSICLFLDENQLIQNDQN